MRDSDAFWLDPLDSLDKVQEQSELPNEFAEVGITFKSIFYQKVFYDTYHWEVLAVEGYNLIENMQ